MGGSILSTRMRASVTNWAKKKEKKNGKHSEIYIHQVWKFSFLAQMASMRSEKGRSGDQAAAVHLQPQSSVNFCLFVNILRLDGNNENALQDTLGN